MIPPVLRPSSMPALAKCPRYSPDQSVGEDQKSDGTKRHTALALWLADDPSWRNELGDWDAEGVEWAGEYIRAHAPMSSYPLQIEVTGAAVLSDLTEIPGTPDVFCGPVLFDLKGRDIDKYSEQMDAYVLQRNHPQVSVHVLYATERRAEYWRVNRAEAEERTERIVEQVLNPKARPRVCDFCGWCANRKACPAFNEAGKLAADHLDLDLPPGNIEDITDADGLGKLKRVADAVAEWAKAANSHCKTMALERGVLATGFRIQSRKGNPSIEDAWAAIQAAGLPVEAVAQHLSISLPDLAKAYAAQHGLKEKAARTDVETRLGDLIKRGSTVSYLTPN